jgi:hypothetical protein
MGHPPGSQYLPWKTISGAASRGAKPALPDKLSADLANAAFALHQGIGAGMDRVVAQLAPHFGQAILGLEQKPL